MVRCCSVFHLSVVLWFFFYYIFFLLLSHFVVRSHICMKIVALITHSCWYPRWMCVYEKKPTNYFNGFVMVVLFSAIHHTCCGVGLLLSFYLLSVFSLLKLVLHIVSQVPLVALGQLQQLLLHQDPLSTLPPPTQQVRVKNIPFPVSKYKFDRYFFLVIYIILLSHHWFQKYIVSDFLQSFTYKKCCI